jgi:hypothetical protein
VTCTNCKVYTKPIGFVQRQIAWTNGKIWWWRVPIIAWLSLVFVQNVQNPSFALARTSNVFSAFDLGIHELGHVLFSAFGDFMHSAGGSLFQCLFPLMGIVGCFQKRWYFGAALCWTWFGVNLFDVATYAADARARVLPLATGIAGLYEQGSDEAYDKAHDWYQLLSRTHHLNADLAIARSLRICGGIVMVSGIAWATYLVMRMFSASMSQQNTSPKA